MTSLTKLEINGEINSLTGPLGSMYNTSLVVPALTVVNLWSIGTKPYNTYVIDSVNPIIIKLPEINNNAAKIGYNATIVNGSINNYIIRDFNNNLVMELLPKKSVRLVALNTMQNWVLSSSVIKPNLLPGIDLLRNNVSDYEYSFKNLISSDASVDIIDLSNQVDLQSKIPKNPANPILDVYLSTVGSDANDGLTPGTPVLNLSRALEVVNQQGWNTQININFAAGNYVLPANDAYVFKYTPLGSNSGGYVLKGDAPISMGSYVVSATNNNTLAPTNMAMIDPGFLMVPDLYNGLYVLFTTGTQAGKYFQVSENTANQIYLLTDASFAPGDNFTVYQNSTSITTRGNRFSDGYIIISNLDIILEDRPIINPNEIYSWEVIDSFIIHDNCRILTNPIVTNPYILYYGDTLIASDNSHIFADAYSTQNLGMVYNGSNLTNPSASIRLDFINSFVSTNRVYYNRAIGNFQNSQSFSFTFYYRNVETVQMFASNSYFGQVVFRDCDSANFPLLQLDNNGILFLDTVLQIGLTTQLMRSTNSSLMYFNNTNINQLNVIGNVEGLSSLGMNQVTIADMIGTNPNRTFTDSNVVFNSCNFTSQTQSLDFRCCNCVAFNTVTLNGDLELDFNNSSVSFGSFVTNSTGVINCNNCRIISNSMDFNASNINTRMSLNQCICTFDTLNLSEVQLGGNVISATNCVIGLSNLNLINPGSLPTFGFSFTNTTLSINNINLNNLVNEFVFNAINSVLYFNNVATTTPGTSNFTFNFNNTTGSINGGFNHSGNLNGSTYFVLDYNSYLRIGSMNFNNCQDVFCSMGSDSSLIIDNGSVNNAGKFISKSAQDFRLVKLNNIVFATMNSPSDLIDLEGGKLTMTNLNITMDSITSNYVFNLARCQIYGDNVTVETNTAGCFGIHRFSTLYLNGCVLKSSAASAFHGIHSDNAGTYLSSVAIDGFTNGLDLIRKSHVLMDIVVGVNSQYGVYLFSGSCISQSGVNTVTGGTADVLVGALGTRTWAVINGGLAIDTNDYNTLNPAYVFICQV